MNLAERDALVVQKLAACAPLTGIQAINECVRQLGFSFAGIPGTDSVPSSIVTDVAGIQTAVTDLTVAANRTAAAALLSTIHGSTGVRIVTTPKPATLASTDHFRMRVVASGN